MLYDVIINGELHHLELERADGGWLCRLDGRVVQVDAVLVARDVLSILMEGKSYEIKRDATSGRLSIWVGSVRYAAQVRDPRSLRSRKAGAGDDPGPKDVLAPMTGKVVRLLVRDGAEVEAGQGVAVVEAMKMQNEIKSPKKGIVRKLVAAAGATVNAGDVLATVE